MVLPGVAGEIRGVIRRISNILELFDSVYQHTVYEFPQAHHQDYHIHCIIRSTGVTIVTVSESCAMGFECVAGIDRGPGDFEGHPCWS
jgi:hypothetical protein